MMKFKFFGFGGREKPVAEAPRYAALPLPSSTAGTTNPPPKRVLIVDDDPVFTRATSMKLHSAGFQVSTAKEGSEAIALLGDLNADVVLLDINFPPDVCNGGLGSWDGFGLLYWLRGLTTTRATRFIMVSSSTSPDYGRRAQKLGAAGFLQKPLQHDRLLALINGTN
jgi:CheY-like chemotaxis protein